MNPKQLVAASLAAVVAISGIGSILIANHTPEDVNAVELTTDGEGRPDPDRLDPAILRRDDAADDGLEALDDDDADPTGDGVTSLASAPSAVSAASAQSKASAASAVSKASAASAVSVASAPSKASVASAPSKASVASAPSASVASASADSASASADSDD